jgi:hypothetical protein
MNLALSVVCPYCRAERHEPCRDTVRNVPLDVPHPTRVAYAEDVLF